MRSITPLDVSIIVVSYNTNAMTRAALDSVLAQTHTVSYEVIAVDNASRDGSADMIAAHPVNARLIRLHENIGFARANTLAAKFARGRLLLLLNPAPTRGRASGAGGRSLPTARSIRHRAGAR